MKKINCVSKSRFDRTALSTECLKEELTILIIRIHIPAIGTSELPPHWCVNRGLLNNKAGKQGSQSMQLEGNEMTEQHFQSDIPQPISRCEHWYWSSALWSTPWTISKVRGNLGRKRDRVRNVIFPLFFILTIRFLVPHIASPSSFYERTHCAVASAHLGFWSSEWFFIKRHTTTWKVAHKGHFSWKTYILNTCMSSIKG